MSWNPQYYPPKKYTKAYDLTVLNVMEPMASPQTFLKPSPISKQNWLTTIILCPLDHLKIVIYFNDSVAITLIP